MLRFSRLAPRTLTRSMTRRFDKAHGFRADRPVVCGEDTGEDYALYGVRVHGKELLREHGIEESKLPPKPMSSMNRSSYRVKAWGDDIAGSGGLSDALSMFAEHNVEVSRVNTQWLWDGFYFDIDVVGDPKQNKSMLPLLEKFRAKSEKADFIPAYQVPWFPQTLEDCNLIGSETMQRADLGVDHPGWKDEEYMARRQSIVDVADRYKVGTGQPHEHINYAPEEQKCWGKIYDRLYPLHQKYACKEHNEGFQVLIREANYSREEIPQLETVNRVLDKHTQMQLMPVGGLLSSRNFLNGLAFRILFCTQYIRHHSSPFFTPEPDVVHELLGHAPLFTNPTFADFSQEIGIASLGATDEEIFELAKVYGRSVEFGLLMEGNERKAYGAATLSSFGEVEFACTSDEPKLLEWNPMDAAAGVEFPMTIYQPAYYVAQSLEDAKKHLRNYTSQMDRPFSLKWNRDTKSFDVDRNIVRLEKKAAQLVYTYSEEAPEDNKGVNPELLEAQEEAAMEAEETPELLKEAGGNFCSMQDAAQKPKPVVVAVQDGSAMKQ